VSRSNGSLVAKRLCTLVSAIAGLSVAMTVAKAWRAEAMAVLLVSVIIGCRDSKRSLRLLLREMASSIGLLMMT